MSIFDRRVLIALLNRGKMAASPLRVSACVLAAITVCLLVAQASAAAGKKNDYVAGPGTSITSW